MAKGSRGSRPVYNVRAKTGRKDEHDKDIFMTVGAAWSFNSGTGSTSKSTRCPSTSTGFSCSSRPKRIEQQECSPNRSQSHRRPSRGGLSIAIASVGEGGQLPRRIDEAPIDAHTRQGTPQMPPLLSSGTQKLPTALYAGGLCLVVVTAPRALSAYFLSGGASDSLLLSFSPSMLVWGRERSASSFFFFSPHILRPMSTILSTASTASSVRLISGAIPVFSLTVEASSHSISRISVISYRKLRNYY